MTNTQNDAPVDLWLAQNKLPGLLGKIVIGECEETADEDWELVYSEEGGVVYGWEKTLIRERDQDDIDEQETHHRIRLVLTGPWRTGARDWVQNGVAQAEKRAEEQRLAVENEILRKADAIRARREEQTNG